MRESHPNVGLTFPALVVIETLLSALTDQESEFPGIGLHSKGYLTLPFCATVSDTEYQSKAEMQEKLDIYIEYLGRVQCVTTTIGLLASEVQLIQVLQSRLDPAHHRHEERSG